MSTDNKTLMDQPATRSWVQDGFVQFTGKLRELLDPLVARIADLEAETVSLRRALSVAAAEAGQRRRIADAQLDPDDPDRVRLVFDDASYAVLSVQAHRALAGWADAAPAGRA